MEIHVLPYGRVDAILIGDKNEWVFVDSGYRKDGKKAVEYMKKLGIKKLKGYIATHRHRNHVGGAPFIIHEMKAEKVYTITTEMKDRLASLTSVKEEKNTITMTPFSILKIEDTFKIGDIIFECLGPDKLKKCSSGAYSENQNSMILKATKGNRSILLTGDTNASILNKCANYWGKTKMETEVLKNPHHNGALGEKILKIINPDYVIICNTKHPSNSYQKLISKIKAKLFTAGSKADKLVILKETEDGWTRMKEG